MAATAAVLLAGLLGTPAGAVGTVLALTSSGTTTTSTSTATPSPTPTTQTTTPKTAPAVAALPAMVVANRRISRLLAVRVRNTYLRRALAVEVVDAASGTRVYSRFALTPLMPASNNKVVTAVTALTTMGPLHRFPTSLRLDPLPPGPKPSPSPTTTKPSPTTTTPPVGATGTTGATGPTGPSPTTTSPPPTTPTPKPTPPAVRTVHIVAGGDPDLSSSNLRSLVGTAVTALKSRRVASVRVALDDYLFPKPTAAPGWTSGYQPYVVRPVRAFVRDGNVATDVAAEAARYVTARFVAGGIKAVYVGRSHSPRSALTIASYRGHTVANAVVSMMQPSDNQIAEMLFRHSALATSRPATWAGGSAAARATLASLAIPLAGVRTYDGSGVSRSDRLTARALTTLMLRIVDRARYPKLQTLLYDGGLPVSGVSGTLANRYRVGPSVCARGKVFAKTGTLHDVVALSGVTRGSDGRRKVFSILLNGVSSSADKTLVRRAVDGLAATVNGCW